MEEFDSDVDTDCDGANTTTNSDQANYRCDCSRGSCQKQLIRGLLPKTVDFLETHPHHKTHFLRLRQNMAIPQVSSRRIGDSRKLSRDHPDHDAEKAEDDAKLMMVLYGSYRDKDSLLVGHRTFLDAYASWKSTCTPFTQQLMNNDLNDHICKRLQTKANGGGGGYDTDTDNDDDDDIAAAAHNFTRQFDDTLQEYDWGLIDQQRMMGPLVNAVTDSMTAHVSAPRPLADNREMAWRTCAVCARGLSHGAEFTTVHVIDKPPSSWQACLKRGEGTNIGEYMVDFNPQHTIHVAVEVGKQWQALVLSDDTSCWKVNLQNIRDGLFCCKPCQDALSRNKVPEHALVSKLKMCPPGSDPLKYGITLKGDMDERTVRQSYHLPMCFDKLDEAFTHVDCPLDNVGLSAPSTSEPTSSAAGITFPSVNTVSLEWKLNSKQHAAFVILCASLLRRHILNTPSTIENNQRYGVSDVICRYLYIGIQGTK